jgi:hypothetical protein
MQECSCRAGVGVEHSVGEKRFESFFLSLLLCNGQRTDPYPLVLQHNYAARREALFKL